MYNAEFEENLSVHEMRINKSTINIWIPVFEKGNRRFEIISHPELVSGTHKLEQMYDGVLKLIQHGLAS